jgi:hypothetical protein
MVSDDRCVAYQHCKALLQASDGRDAEDSSSSEEVSADTRPCTTQSLVISVVWVSELRCTAQESDASEQLDEGFLKAFARIKQRDASIYDADARLFDGASPSGSGSDEDDSSKADAVAASASAGRQKEHPKFLRQVLAEQVGQGCGLPVAVLASDE